LHLQFFRYFIGRLSYPVADIAYITALSIRRDNSEAAIFANEFVAHGLGFPHCPINFHAVYSLFVRDAARLRKYQSAATVSAASAITKPKPDEKPYMKHTNVSKTPSGGATRPARERIAPPIPLFRGTE
jgi:hypothetical protein